MVNSGPGSGPGLLRLCRKDSCQISLSDLTGQLSAKVDSAAIQEANKKVSNYLDRYGNLECNYPFPILLYDHCQRVSHYVSARDTVNLLLLCGAGFFCELHRPHYCESFPTNNRFVMCMYVCVYVCLLR